MIHDMIYLLTAIG